MNDPRLDSVLQAAASRIQAAVSKAVDKVAVQLGPLALAATSNQARQQLMTCERELKLKADRILRSFQREFQDQLDKLQRPAQVGSPAPAAQPDWDALSLVDNQEVERGVWADRLAQTLTQDCEEHLKGLFAHVATLLSDKAAEQNPLRPQAVAKALLEALAGAECDEDTCLTLAGQMGRVLGPELNAAYGLIVQDMRQRGIQAQGMAVHRSRGASSGHGAFSPSAAGGLPTDMSALASKSGAFPESGRMPPSGFAPTLPAPMSLQAHQRAAQALSHMFGVNLPTAPMGMDSGFLMGHADSLGHSAAAQAARSDFQHLLRRIALQPAPVAWSADHGLGAMGGLGAATGADLAAGQGMGSAAEGMAAASFAGPMMAVNLIRAHREELIQATGGAALDQMVIDIVAALFDQVLSDPKVAPQMARQIARLQMPVLRVAMGDMSFFNSRKHPVRRFVNRIATLSASFDDYEQGAGLACLERVTALVNAIVEGDFDNMAVYESKLGELESFIDDESARDAAEHAAVAALLSGKEADLRVQQRYMQILKRELADVELPEFVRDFITQIWSQVQVMATARDGAGSPFSQRMKKAGHDLALSVQPKGHPQLRKAFLLTLPGLMRDLNEGLGLIQWPEEAKQAFFAQLLPAHAECLKTAPHHDLTQRMLEQRLNKVEQIAIPSREDAANDPLPAPLADLSAVPTLTVVAALSQEEVKQAGFVPEAVIAREAKVDIDLDAPGEVDPSLSEVDINLDAPPPPAAGAQLVHHIQKGTAYQMHMQGQWKKVRLTWISEGRNFFIFTHGQTHKETISLTARTLAKMCEGNRFKAFEQAELIERATVRARRQLAALSADARTRSAA
ncbi:MAG: DUF1631 family protein [Proteobacteria bacterium]|uniref:DUF1631 family protein n=1 Tax=Aquabacterium sp. TaxID=1872578 RepID=UPI0035C71F73|nr:DUF1631 family protein [Pseudomonadota bacterium]